MTVMLVNALSAAPAEETIQGIYEGTWKGAKAEGRLVAMGKGTFKLLLRSEAKGKVQRAELDGKLEKGSIAFTGKDAKATYGDGAITGAVKMKRVVRKSPTLGKKPPTGAVVLIDGKDFKNMKPGRGEWPKADKKDGSIEVPKGGMNSIPKFAGSYDCHVEFRCNLKSTARSQGRGNSGFYTACGKEIQVLDSFGMTTYLGGGCGGLYRFKDPDTMEPIPSLAGKKENVFNLAALPPLQWQAYDVEYRVKPGKDGKPKGHLTVYHNGIKIHDAVELNHRAGGFHFQDHGNPVRYRNIWVIERK